MIPKIAIPVIVAHFGGQNSLARILSTRQSTVWGWVSKNRVPSQRIPEIIAAAAKLNPPVTLRPDDFFDLSAPAPQPRRRRTQPAPQAST